MWLCILTDRQFEETYKNAQWIKARQMQAMWLCILPSKHFEDTFENAQCNQWLWQCDYALSLYRNVTYVTLHPPGQTIWGHIWKRTLEKSQTNATNVTIHRLIQALWGDIWKHTMEKSQINATNVTMHPLMQAIWGSIWKCTVEKSQTNATNVTMPLLGQAIRGHILRCTMEKSQTNATNGTMPALILVHWGNMWKTQWRSVIQMQPMWLCVFSCRWFEDTFEKRKVLFFAQASRVKRKILNTFLQFREEKESIEEEEEKYLTLRAEWVKLFAPQPWHHSRKYWLC